MTPFSRRILPGFGPGLIWTLVYLNVLVLIPLAAVFLRAANLNWSEFVAATCNDRALAAYRLTFLVSLQAAVINLVIGLVVSWTLVRYSFPGKRIVDALIDVPFALPTAVAGLVYASLYARTGVLGQYLCLFGIEGAYSQTGIVLVLVFTGFPFVIRTVQPVLEDLDRESEQAAATLGANRLQTFCWVILPVLVPPLVTGFTLAFARAVGEYGSVIFISSNMPYETEIAPVLIVSRLEEFAYREAAAIAVVLLVMSFALLGAINLTQRWTNPGEAPRWIRTFLRWWFTALTAPLLALFRYLQRRKVNSTQSCINWAARMEFLASRVLIVTTSLIVFTLIMLPVFTVFANGFREGAVQFVGSLISDSDTRHAILLTLLVAPLAVALNTAFGIAAAYTIARFRFPGRTLLTTLIDLPFTVSPVVAGLALILVFGLHTPIGAWLKDHGYQIMFAPPGLVLATAFVTVPFVARELIPVLEANGPDEELAARSLGASGWQSFFRVTLPNVKWGLIYGVILCNARAMGEFGAIYVVSGRIGGRTDTMPLRVEKLLQEYNQQAAFALASLLAVLALATLLIKFIVEQKSQAESSTSEGIKESLT